MKKIKAMLLCMCLSFSLAACGGNEGEADTPIVENSAEGSSVTVEESVDNTTVEESTTGEHVMRVIPDDGVAGLYDAEGNRLCSWEELGVDVEVDIEPFTATNAWPSGECIYVAINKYPTATKVVLPEGIERIGDSQFSEVNSIDTIVIPESVKEIGGYAFSTEQIHLNIPKNLTDIDETTLSDLSSSNAIHVEYDTSTLTIDVDPENPNYKMEDGVLFNGDKTKLLMYLNTDRTEYSVPEGVTEILDYCFAGHQELTSM